jgi:hypothetical protein
MLKQFNIDTQRDLLAPDFACYQMDLMGPVNAAIAAGEVDEDFSNLPSWAKFAANPIKSKGFFTRTLQAMFLGQCRLANRRLQKPTCEHDVYAS